MTDKPNIDFLITAFDINNSIIELDNYIGELCSWGDALGKLTEPQKHFYFNQNLEREVNNGGFSQFFFNSSGNFTHETVVSLNAIGANKTAKILQEAIDQFPLSKVPIDQEERRELLEKIESEADPIWSELDQQFYNYEDDLNELNIQYIKQNRNSF